MRAVALDAAGAPRLVDRPEPAAAGRLVNVRACGLCGSDLEKLGDPARAGSVLGHEIAGELSDGTPVTVAHRVPCGRCDRCRAGHGSTCAEFEHVRIDPGGFAERLRATHVFPLPAAVRREDGIWVEPLACVLRAARHVPRGRVHVVGCGAVGLLWAQVLLARGDEVTVSEPRDDRRRQALELGAVAAGRPAEAAVLTAHAGLGPALASLAPGGTLLVFCSPSPAGLDDLYRRELRIVGSRSAEPEQFAEALQLLPTLWLPPVEILPLERFAEGVERYRSGAALKVAFVP